MTKEELKKGDIIARTTIADRIVISIEGNLHTVKLNNGRVESLSFDDFDIVIGNVYNLHLQQEKIKLPTREEAYKEQRERMTEPLFEVGWVECYKWISEMNKEVK